MDEYERIYGRHADFFGAAPEPLLERFADGIEAGGRVLDIGAGQGRNALWLAERGFRVTALEPAGVAARQLAACSRRPGTIEVVEAAVEDYQPEYALAAVLCFGVIQVLTVRQREVMAGRVTAWLEPGGLLLVTAFSIRDPSYAHWSRRSQIVGRHCLRTTEGVVRAYLEPGEILELFPRLEVVHHREGLGPWHRHAGGEPERHELIEAVFRRRP